MAPPGQEHSPISAMGTSGRVNYTCLPLAHDASSVSVSPVLITRRRFRRRRLRPPINMGPRPPNMPTLPPPSELQLPSRRRPEDMDAWFDTFRVAGTDYALGEELRRELVASINARNRAEDERLRVLYGENYDAASSWLYTPPPGSGRRRGENEGENGGARGAEGDVSIEVHQTEEAEGAGAGAGASGSAGQTKEKPRERGPLQERREDPDEIERVDDEREEEEEEQGGEDELAMFKDTHALVEEGDKHEEVPQGPRRRRPDASAWAMPGLEPDGKHYTKRVRELEPVGYKYINFKIPGTMIMKGTDDTLDASYESLDYHVPNNFLRKVYLREKGETTRVLNVWHAVSELFLSCVIGILTGVTAFSIFYLIDLFSVFKYYQFLRVLTSFDVPDVIRRLRGCALIVFWNLGLCFLANLIVRPCGVAVGSGIPNIKAYLNGINVPKVLRIDTFWRKTLGVIFSVSGGLPVGKEGPMIHAGSIIGGGFSQGLSTSFSFTLKWFSRFRNDAYKRDFVAAGAAGGVAAAFGAPFGGVFFALEEGISFYEYRALFMCLVSSLSSYWALNSLKGVIRGTGEISSGGLVSFGVFEKPLRTEQMDIGMAVLIGVLGGLLGATWNGLNTRLTRLRLRWITTSNRKMFEVFAWSMVTTTVAFVSLSELSDCKSLEEKETNRFSMQLSCPDGKYHALGALWFETPENCVKDMLHTPTNTYSVTSLGMFFVCYYFFTCATYGMWISSGLFVPNLCLGALWGRLIGIFLHTFFPQVAWLDTGVYALLGAAAQLSGLVRMTFSLSMILMEATQGYSILIPLMVTVLASKAIASLFNHGIYEIHMDLSGVPFLYDELPDGHTELKPKDVMATPVVCLRTRMKLLEVSDLTLNRFYSAFPVTDPVPDDEVGKHFGRLRGVVYSKDIATKFFERFFDGHDETRTKETWERYIAAYPRWFRPHETWRHDPESTIQQDNVMRLDDIMDLDVHTVPVTCTLKHLFETFINERLRQLIVVDQENNVVGIVTRKDLAGLCSSYGKSPWWKKATAMPVVKAKNWFYPSVGRYSWIDHHERFHEFVPFQGELGAQKN